MERVVLATEILNAAENDRCHVGPIK